MRFIPFVVFFSQQRKLGVFTLSKGPGAGRSSQSPDSQGLSRLLGSQEGVPKQGFQEQVAKQGSH